MSNILSTERATYEQAFSVDAYSAYSPGEKYVPAFLAMAGLRQDDVGLTKVLDAGCGSGKGGLALRKAGCAVTLCDFVDERSPEVRDHHALPFHQIETLWSPIPLGTFDYVYCTDVLEHVPPEFTMLTIARMLEVSRQGVFLSIALVPDGFGVWIGKSLHQTVRGFTWWRDNIATLGRIVECRDLLQTGLFYVEPHHAQ
tara:strand:- start:663 stop:1259 length:597 start_codon:yes stop_codon:yes gene_type:complete